MASKNEIKVGIRIGATDDATGVIQGMVNKANMSMSGLMGGLIASGLAYKGEQAIGSTVDAFAGQEAALARVRIMTMKVGDAHEDTYLREKKFIEDLSSRYTGSVEDYARMQETLLRYRLTPEDIMGGIGEETAKIGVVFDVAADQAAMFFGKMKNDFKIPVEQMDIAANMLSKVRRMGVGVTGADAVNEMTQAFGQEGLAVQNLGLYGAKAANDIGILTAMFITKGMTGQRAGTNLRRLLDAARDPEKNQKIQAGAAAYGINIDFWKNGKFGGIPQFVEQLEKLQRLSPTQIAGVLEPFSGKMGQSQDVVDFLAKFGTVDFAQFKEFENSLIGVNDEFKQLQGTLKYIETERLTNMTNLKAAIGGSMAKDLKRYNLLLADAATGMKKLVDAHPEAVGVVTEILAGTVAMGGMISVLKMMGGLSPVFTAISTGLTRAFGPILLAAAALELLKYNYDNAEINRQKIPGGHFDKEIRGYDEKIEANRNADSGISGLLANMFWGSEKIIANMRRGIMGGQAYEHRFDYAEQSAESAAKNDIARKEVYSYPGEWNGKPMINYAPTVNLLSNSSMNLDLESIFRQNSDTLGRAIDKHFKDKANTTYGK